MNPDEPIDNFRRNAVLDNGMHISEEKLPDITFIKWH